MITTITQTIQETQSFAEEFAQTLHGGEVLCLYGDLGYGKTTFIQGLAKGLGIKKKIISPTFIIMRTYKVENTKQNAESISFHHVDLYRMNSEHEVFTLGLHDIMNKAENIVAIGWPEKMGTLLPKKRIDIKLEYIDEDKRKITLEYIS